VLLAVASLIAVAGVALAWGFYGRGPSKTVERWIAQDGVFADVYRASKAKLWVDEFYDAILVRPFKVVARFLLEFVDRFVVDTVAVNGSAFVVGIFGRISRWFQNGNVQRYLVGVVVGGALVFVITDCHHKATFDYKIVGNEIRLHADPGSGILGATARVHWDLDGAIEKNVREFIAAMLVLETGMVGAFVALDLFVFYVFWEVMLIPMYFIIGIWGGERRLYASIKFVIYTMVGSLLMLVAILYVYVQATRCSGSYTFDYETLLDV
jgi:NADH:ubiquinone oxidoreductase subunit 5 (subunit L)/multisubunit Na+/H+ antiporter MnhA subunit